MRFGGILIALWALAWLLVERPEIVCGLRTLLGLPACFPGLPNPALLIR